MKFWKRVKKCRAVPAASGLMSVVFASPAFAADAGGGMTSLLASFTQVAAWMWSEIGLLLTWILNQPILLLAFGAFPVLEVFMEFLTLFGDIVLYPLSVEVNTMDNPLTLAVVASLIGIGFTRMVRRLLCI